MTYSQLDPLAASYGIGAPGARFRLEQPGRVVEVGLEIDSGRPNGITISVFSAPRSEVDFIHGTPDDFVSQDEKIGDAAFDEAVWIDTSIDREALARMLARSEARAAIVELLTFCDRVRFGPHGIVVGRPVQNDPYSVPLARRAIELLVQLDAALPVEPPARARGYPLANACLGLSSLYAAAGLLAFTVGLMRFMTIEATAFWIGFVVNLALVPIAIGIAALLIRGRPRSSGYITVMGLVCFCSLPFHGVGDGLFVNAVLAPEPPELARYRVIAVIEDDESEDELQLEPLERPGERCTLSAGGFEQGQIVTARRGLFGWQFLYRP